MPKAGGTCRTFLSGLAKLELVSVSKRFGRVTAVDDVSFVVEDNETFLFVRAAGMRQIDDLTVISGA